MPCLHTENSHNGPVGTKYATIGKSSDKWYGTCLLKKRSMYLKLPKKYHSEKVTRECSCGWTGELYRGTKFCPKCGENVLHPGDPKDLRKCANGHIWKGIFKSRCPICNRPRIRDARIGKYQSPYFDNNKAPLDIECGFFDGNVIKAENKIVLKKVS